MIIPMIRVSTVVPDSHKQALLLKLRQASQDNPVLDSNALYITCMEEKRNISWNKIN